MPDASLAAVTTATTAAVAASPSFNMVDIGIAIGLLIFILIGIIRGFTNDVLSLLTWVGAIFMTSFIFPVLQPHVRPYISEPFFADIVLGFLIFILSLIFLVAIAKGISGMVRRSMLSGLDRSLGLISGTFRATVLLTGLYLGSLLFFKPGALPSAYEQARLLPLITASAQWVYLHVIPHEFFPKRLVDHLFPADQKDKKEPSAEDLVKSLSSPKPGSKEDKPGSEPTVDKKDRKSSLEEGYKIMERKALESLIDNIAPSNPEK